MSEAYGAAAHAIRLLQASGRCGDRGAGAVLLDVCSGKGLTAVLLSFLLPEAQCVLLDSNGAMDLGHVARRPNLRFEQLDLFGSAARAALDAAAQGGACCVAIGTHLCGALSPRLLDLARRVPRIDGLVLSPCCLRGALGAKIGKAGRARRVDPYRLLVDVLAALAVDDEAQLAHGSQSLGRGEDGDGGDAARPPSVSVVWDAAVLSPKHAFIILSKDLDVVPCPPFAAPCEECDVR